ncbi:MAG: hypothetical protein CME64_15060 [Halobacteriovoraceae bacterium]|nr:hypothetical protein [Halobacteriovoraceae bacterium]|tara:strand:+ start:52627 stop:53970 length:1344 start_codon:yes stop_codon:yes gene_type:complete
MSNKVLEILNRFSIVEKVPTKLLGIEWKAQEAKQTDILFYHLKDKSESSINLMKERLNESSYGIVIYNSDTDLNVPAGHNLSEADLQKVKIELLDELYPLPDKKYIAITGTNGKTTTVDIVSQLSVQMELNCLTVGTLGARINGVEVANFSLTSPDFIDLRKTIHRFKDKFDICALEASSHALGQGRLGNLRFDAVGWTSFSQDHLDYHKTMEDYFCAKKSLLNFSDSNFIVSSKSKELKARLGESGTEFKLAKHPEQAFFKSEFNQINLEVALGCLERSGFDTTSLNLKELTPPPGRFNTIVDGDNVFIIDFAHTPDALENICKEVKKAFSDKSIVCVFGCGGNRDSSKRPLMGKAASSYCDYVIITTDNPRFENPDSIIEDIIPGVTADYKKITDRKEAISYAFNNFKNSAVILAGKGHEPYIDVKGEKKPFSDEGTLKELIGRR